MRSNGKAMKSLLGTARQTFSPGVPDEVALLDGLFTAPPVLGPAGARRAYALVALAHPHMTAREWDGFARRHARAGTRGRGGLVAVEDRRRYVHAVFRYAVDTSPFLGSGRTLRLHDVVMAQLPGHALIQAVAACAENLAAGLGCTVVALDLPAASATAAAMPMSRPCSKPSASGWARQR